MKSVFISSTFRDMQIERDALHTRIFPSLNEEAAKYSEIFTGIDLRWGIHTSSLSEEEADKKAFLTCFEEIDSSRPYFIAFIGDRYGTNVDETSISRIFSLILNKDKMTKEEADAFIKRTSITQKEIEYATFASKIAPSHCFFFFRKGYGKTLSKDEKAFWIENNKESKEKLDELKRQIKAKYPNSFYEYSLEYNEDKGFFLPESEIKEFAACIIRTFLRDYKQKKTSPLDALRQQMEFFSKERDFGFFGREKDYIELKKFLKNPEENILILNGTSGLGKTSLLSHLIEAEKENYNFLPIFIGTTPAFMSESGILKYLHQRLVSIKGLDPNSASDFKINDEAKYKNVSPEIIRCISIKRILLKPSEESEKEVVIVLDSINTIHGNPCLENLDFIPVEGLGFGTKVKIIISTTNDSLLSLYKCAASGLIKYELKSLNKEDIKTISYNVLTKVFHKESSEKMIENIIKKKNSFEPLYLSLLLRRLLLVNRHDFDLIYQDATSEDARYNYLENLIKNEADLSEKLAISLFEKVVEFSRANFLNAAFSYISISPFGLTVQDLEELVPEFDESDFYIAVRFLDPLFYRDEHGRISFSHERIKGSVQHAKKTTIEETTLRLISFFEKKGEARYAERVNLIFNSYSNHKFLLEDLLEEQDDETLNPLVFNSLYTKLVEEFDISYEGEQIIFTSLYQNHHFDTLSKLLKRAIDEAKLTRIDLNLINNLGRQYPIEDEVSSGQSSVSLALYSLMLMILKELNMYPDALRNTIQDIPYEVFKIAIFAKSLTQMCSLFIVSCFKYFGIASYDKDFVKDFIKMTETLGKDYAIYHLITKELLILNEPEDANRTYKIENLLGEATFINNKNDNTDLERFISRVSITYFLNYVKDHDVIDIFNLTQDALHNANCLLYTETSYEYPKNLAKLIYSYAEAARLFWHKQGNDLFYYVSLYKSKSSFLLSSYLASNNLENDMIEVAINSLQMYLSLTVNDKRPIMPKALKVVDSLVNSLVNKNRASNLIKAKHLMLHGFLSIDKEEYERAEKFYRSALSYLDNDKNYQTIIEAYSELKYALAEIQKKDEENTQLNERIYKTIKDYNNFLISSFEKGLQISYFDCEEIRSTYRDVIMVTKIEPEIYDIVKIYCYTCYCSFYRKNRPEFIQNGIKFRTMILIFLSAHPELKNEQERFLATLKLYDQNDIMVRSMEGLTEESINSLVNSFSVLLQNEPFEAFKILTIFDRGGFYLEKQGMHEEAFNFYSLCARLNNEIIGYFRYSFGLQKEYLISLEALNRVHEKLTNHYNPDLAIRYLVCFANMLNNTPFRSLKSVDDRQIIQLENALKISIADKTNYEHFAYVIDSMDIYYSNVMNFKDMKKYEREYILFSYYRILFGYLTDNQKHINQGCNDMFQSFQAFAFPRLYSLRESLDEAELACLVTYSTMFNINGPRELVDAFNKLKDLYPEALVSRAIARLKRND